MTQAYADQIPALALAMSATIFVGVRIASRIHDRNTRRLEARRGD